MSHKLKIGQAVIPAFREHGSREIHRIVRLVPGGSAGSPHYEVQCRTSGARRVVSENEIKLAFPAEGGP